MEDDSKRKREVETRVVHKVGEVISAIKSAKHVDQILCALHSLAVLLFPVESSLLSGSIDEPYRAQIFSSKVPATDERADWWQAFYQGSAFSTLARFLLFDIASNWLACFPFSAQKHVYDVFFVNGLASEVVQILVPCLHQDGNDGFDVIAVHSNIERLLVLCLLENHGVLKIAREFRGSFQSVDFTSGRLKPAISSVARTIASVPDKAQLKGPASLSSHLFFKQIIIQIVSALEEISAVFTTVDMDGTLLFAGETFSRICRRGSLDVLLSELVPRLLGHVRGFLASNTELVGDAFESNPSSQFWLKMMEAIVDPYAVERLSEQLLHYLATEDATDVEGYWILWILFHRVLNNHMPVRFMFVDKFLFWKIFPTCCLRWILQFAVLECPPGADLLTKAHESGCLIETMQQLASTWSKREFLQSASIEQQAYVTAALGMCLEKTCKEELDKTKDVLHAILQGVSCRLESPTNLIRKMGSSIALAFSRVIDPKNPLYLDDSWTGDTIDWDFGVSISKKGTIDIPHSSTTHNGDEGKRSTTSLPVKDTKHTNDYGSGDKVKGTIKENSVIKVVDPDEIIDLATLNYESVSDEDDNGNENTDSWSDSSLQPYDLSDDDTDLKPKFSQLVDVVGALKKSDDADGVERAISVAEKLVRAAPDELAHVAGDLVRSLVQVRCSDFAVEGEEESTEEKRQKALVALLVTSPFESLNTLNKLLYSPNVDISQRIMILDIMTDAAQELASSKTLKPKRQSNAVISITSEPQPWFLPSNSGPPGAGSWKEISDSSSLLNWSDRYERELPPKPGQVKRGKTRRWSLRSANIQGNQVDWSHNKFPVYAAAFMLPAMQGFDKKRHGVDLLGRDFIVLGKLIYMLGICIKCTSMHPEASALAPSLLDMLRSREICHHKEAYVRRAVLFAASCVLAALHPSYVASALVDGNTEIAQGLEWVRTWALHVADSDTDRECYTMAMSCLQLHAEMALQASRAVEMTGSTFRAKGVGLPSDLPTGTIKIPYSNVEY